MALSSLSKSPLSNEGALPEKFSKPQVRRAQRRDALALVDLAADMMAFYGADHIKGRIANAPQMESFVSDLSSGEGILVAEVSGRVVGFAAYCHYPAVPFAKRALFLLDLFVQKDQRRQGVGRALLSRLSRMAKEGGLDHLDWTADVWNDGSLAFYHRIAEADQVDKVYHRLGGAALDRLARQDTGT